MGGKNSKPIINSRDSKQRPKQAAIAQEQITTVAVPNNTENAPLIDAYFIPVLQCIINEYLSYDIEISSSVNTNIHSIFHRDEVNIYKQAFAIARDYVLTAGPLDALEAAVRQNPNVLLPKIKITKQFAEEELTFEGTLEQLAMIMLDQTIISEPNANPGATPFTPDEGMIERLRNLRETLLSHTLSQAVDQARIAAPLEEKQNEEPGPVQSQLLDDIFEKIKKNNFASARSKMKAYIKSIKPAVITDNKYFLNLVQLIPWAFKLLAKRVNELRGRWNGIQAGQYCYTTAGVIATALSYVLRRRLDRGAYYLLVQGANIDRAIDVSDAAFIGAAGSNSELGVNFFFDDLGACVGAWQPAVVVAQGGELLGVCGHFFSILYQQLHQRSKTYAAAGHSTEKQCDDVVQSRINSP